MGAGPQLTAGARLGFVPCGMVAVEQGWTRGHGRRVGAHVRALCGGAGAQRRADGSWSGTLGLECPLLPVPVVY